MSLGLITVAQALQQARSQGVDKLDAQVLLANILQKPRTWLLAHDDAALDAAPHKWRAFGLCDRA
jgi:release factor glutamine methyltransferase